MEYLYDGGARLVSKKTTSQGLNRTRKYLYADSGNAGLMVGIIDEQGTRYATWTYDDQGRAISSEHANGAEKVSSPTTMTTPPPSPTNTASRPPTASR